MLKLTNPRLRRSNVVLNSFSSCIPNTPKEFSWTPKMPSSKMVAFFCTYGGNYGKTFEEMAKISKKPIVTMMIKEKELSSCDKKIKEFCKKIK